MEASLPISAVNPPTARPAVAAPLLGATAPSVTLPLIFTLTGLLALCVGIVWLVIQPSILATYHYNQNVIAATHLFVLGWICSVVMGAMYQLVPVALETKLYSEKLARWQFAFHVVGFVGMVWMFRVWNMEQVGHFGTVLAVGVGLFVYNIARTLWRVPKWNVTATSVSAALAWICLTIILGLCITAAKSSTEYEFGSERSPTGTVAALLHGVRLGTAFLRPSGGISTMHAHAHLGGVGFFMMLIVGVSYKLIPMFTLSEVQNQRRAVGSVILLNVGLAGSFVTILRHSPVKPVFALMVVAALAVYGWELKAILRARKRRALDWGVKCFLTAIVLLLPLSVLAVVLSWPALPQNTFSGQLENLYGFLGLIGAVTLAITGMLYKIIPFLVWFGRYSRQIGRSKVPALADLYSARLQALGYWAWLTGLAVTGAAIVLSCETGIRIGCGFLALGVATLALNVGKMLSHYFKLSPFPVPISTLSKTA
ncbi:MAG TPA: cbb3-type cytochrome c oxidase subunit I [Verrucomicrobiae bacterium]|nr:cbb3-type cytochrome c oxidase subunit I [Verrucomicrobiae bacterium]